MRQGLKGLTRNAIAPAALAVLIANAAAAGDVSSSRTLDIGAGGTPCDAVGQDCPRISGYIKAGSDYSPRDPAVSPTLGQTPRFLAGGEPAPAAPGATVRDTFLLDVSHDERMR